MKMNKKTRNGSNLKKSPSVKFDLNAPCRSHSEKKSRILARITASHARISMARVGFIGCVLGKFK